MENKSAKWPRRLLWVTLVSVCLFFSARVYYRLTDDFRLTHIVHELPFNKNWETKASLSDRHFLKLIFQQPFTYVGKGAQSYVFVSEDGAYVIKFFKFKHLKPSWIVEHLPEIGPIGEYKRKNIARKERQIQSVFSGYKLAYDVHREESGTVFVHLNPTDDLHASVTLFDKIGRKHKMDLDPYIFVIQECGTTSREVMAEALNNGDVELAKKRTRQIIDLYLAEYAKGIYDRDHGVLHNTGFVGDKPIHLDVGKLTDAPYMKLQENWEPDLKLIALKYHYWMKDTYPKYYEEVISTIEEDLSKAFGKPYKVPG
jgi:hypothetical protein